MFLFITFALLISATTDVVQSKNAADNTIAQVKAVASWEGARRRCEKNGAVLASPVTDELLEYMLSYMDADASAAYFIGTRAKRTPPSREVKFVSAEGTQLSDMPAAVINMIEKIDPRDGDCLSMDRRSIQVVPCWERLPFICYSNVTAPPPQQVTPVPTTQVKEPVTPPTVKNTTFDCGEGYINNNKGSCYKFSTYQTSWEYAQSTCSDDKANLVVINDEEEARAISNLVFAGNDYYIRKWIGLRDRRPGGVSTWRSVNGDRLNDIFNEWSDDYKYSAHHTCGSLWRDGKIYAFNCKNYRFKFICEKNY